MGIILSEKEGPLMKSALAYLDDVLCYSESVEEHFEHLREIFIRFRASKMKLNPTKCNFLLPKLVFLRNLINAEGIGPDPDKVKAMLESLSLLIRKSLKEHWECFIFIRNIF